MHAGITRDTYVYQVVHTLWDNLPQLLRGTLLFNLACLPTLGCWLWGRAGLALLVAVVTIGPAWTALLHYDLRLLQGMQASTRTFLQAFRYYWRRSTLLSLLAMLPWLGLWTVWVTLRTAPAVTALIWLGVGANLLALVLIITLLLYAFPYLAHRDLWLYACLRDALILASRYPTHSLGLLALGILLGFGVAYISLGLLLFIPAVYGLFIAANCLLVLHRETAEQHA